MHLLIYLGHPAHFHLFKGVIKEMQRREHKVSILIKKKDVLEDLLKESGYPYTNILPEGRRDNKSSIGMGLLKRDYRMLQYVKSNRPDLMAGTSPEITHIGKLLGIKSIVVNEDDADQVPLFAKLSYPLADSILAPISCSTGKWSNKTIYYKGYHELAYLHPEYFTPVSEKVRELNEGGAKKYFILRFAKLSAHHDTGKAGITTEIASRIIRKLKPLGNVFITSERELEAEFERYRISIKPQDMHDALYYSEMFIGDSQTMAAESAVLGTPSIRYNDFVGKLGYLEELEHKYGLTYGIRTTEPEELFTKIDELLSMQNIKEEWGKRRERMLSETIDVSSFMSWLFENYPRSLEMLKTGSVPQQKFNRISEKDLQKAVNF